MYNNINVQLVSKLCPNGMSKQNCPARQYVVSKPDLFNQSSNEDLVTLAKPFKDNRDAYTNAFLTIVEKCEQCHKGR